MATTIREIAKELGVNISTVSRSLNNSPSVSAQTRDKVLEAARRLGYRRDARATALRTGKSGIIGVVVGDIVNPFFAQLADSIEKKAQDLDLRLMIGNGGEDPHQQEQVVGTMMEHQIDGLLLTPAGTPTNTLRNYVKEIPTVAIDRSLAGANVDTVLSEDSPAVDELMKHVTRQGYRSAVVISGPATTSTGLNRERLLSQSLRDIGVKTRTYRTTYHEESGAEAIAQALRENTPDIVLCASSVITLGVIAGLHRHGLRVGEDVAIATFDKVPWLVTTMPSIAVIDTKIDEMADIAMRILRQRIGGNLDRPLMKTVTSQLLLPAEPGAPHGTP